MIHQENTSQAPNLISLYTDKGELKFDTFKRNVTLIDATHEEMLNYPMRCEITEQAIW